MIGRFSFLHRQYIIVNGQCILPHFSNIEEEEGCVDVLHHRDSAVSGLSVLNRLLCACHTNNSTYQGGGRLEQITSISVRSRFNLCC